MHPHAKLQGPMNPAPSDSSRQQQPAYHRVSLLLSGHQVNLTTSSNILTPTLHAITS